MSIEVTMRHMQSMEDIHRYAESKAQALADTISHCEHVHVILDHAKHLYVAEVVLQAGHHGRVEARESCGDLRAAIDMAVEKAERQIRRVLEKKQDRHQAMKKHEAMRNEGTA